MKAKNKVCKVCKKEYTPYSSTSKACSYECALVIAKIQQKNDSDRIIRNKKKAEKKAHRIQKEKLKTRAQWLREAQTAFNAYVRERDRDEPCISCGRHHEGQYHAGHYLTVSANPELRFHPFNNNKQCAPCNNHLSGNIVKYRPNLIEKIGLKSLEWLEGPQQLQKLTIDEIKEIKAHYKEQLKYIKNLM